MGKQNGSTGHCSTEHELWCHENKFPPKLWGECLCIAAYLKDWTPAWTLKDQTPYEAYYGQQPDVSHLREIGCHAFILVQSEWWLKSYDRSVEGILVGYSQNSKAYCCYYPKTGWIMVTWNVVFIKLKDNYPRPYWPGVQVKQHEEEADEDHTFQQLKPETVKRPAESENGNARENC